MVVRNRKNWRTSSNARQKRDADAKLPHPRLDDTHSTLVQGLRIGWLITHHQPGIMRAVKGTGESQMDWPNGCSSKRHLMEELPVSGRWTHISDSRDLLVRQLDQDITRQPQAKVPLLLTQGVKQLLMHEAAVGHSSSSLMEMKFVSQSGPKQFLSDHWSHLLSLHASFSFPTWAKALVYFIGGPNRPSCTHENGVCPWSQQVRPWANPGTIRSYSSIPILFSTVAYFRALLCARPRRLTIRALRSGWPSGPAWRQNRLLPSPAPRGIAARIHD